MKSPRAFTFEYVFDRQGDRPQERRHRVYREATRERDEILSVNGEKFARPQVHVFMGRRDRYAISSIAPNPDSYAFVYVRSEKNGRHQDYVFDAVPRIPKSYLVTRVTIDGETFLPHKVAYRARTQTLVGTGEITYAKVEQYWMPQTATARANVNGHLQTERIAWAHYRFYPSFPPSTFAQPRQLPSGG